MEWPPTLPHFSLPSARVELVVKLEYRQSQGAGEQGGARQEVEKAANSQPDQEEFDRIADRALIDVELRDIMVRRVGQPQRIPIMHAAMHPILAEVEDEGDGARGGGGLR